jgi:hypothetical protein
MASAGDDLTTSPKPWMLAATSSRGVGWSMAHSMPPPVTNPRMTVATMVAESVVDIGW